MQGARARIGAGDCFHQALLTHRLQRQVKDPRSAQGRNYPLPCLLAIAVCAFTAAGHDRLTAVGQWIARATPADLARLRAPRDPLTGVYRVPDEKTIRVVLDRLEPAELTRALLGQRPRPGRVRSAVDGSPTQAVRAYRQRRQRREVLAAASSGLNAVAVDGKSSRGARRADGRRVHLLGVAGHASSGGRVLGQVEVDAKHNETSHFTDLLGPLELTGQVATFDTLHTARANLDWLVTSKHAHYIAVIKNQPLLHQRVTALPWKDVPTGARIPDHGHGRDETRTLKSAHVEGLDLPHARQAIKITRWRQDSTTRKTSRETVYAVTDLTSAQATAADLARLVREHWGIEVVHQGRHLRRGPRHRLHRPRTDQPGHHPLRDHQRHPRRRLPAHPRRPTRPHHRPGLSAAPRPHMIKTGNSSVRRSPDRRDRCGAWRTSRLLACAE
jgi:predicted transposase YbfD/YdcC